VRNEKAVSPRVSRSTADIKQAVGYWTSSRGSFGCGGIGREIVYENEVGDENKGRRGVDEPGDE